MIQTENVKGLFVVSLDFELFWGIRDKYDFDTYGKNVLGVWEVIPKLVETFAKYDIHATFATVGMMFSENLAELKSFLPELKPNYKDSNLSPYLGYIEDSTQNDSRYYFGKQLLDLIKNDSRHEIGSHSFSHYYGLEEGQNKEEFEADLIAALKIAEFHGLPLKSFVFPRHQINSDYLEVLEKKGVHIYRETEKAWFHSPSKGAEESILKRAIRYFDYYLNLGGAHCQDLREIKRGNLYGIRASRWMRPFKESEAKWDSLKIKRIKSQMNYAAKNSQIFHLWFHPHDIGINQDKNFEMLEEILRHYEVLKEKYGMQSVNMAETVKIYKDLYEL